MRHVKVPSTKSLFAVTLSLFVIACSTPAKIQEPPAKDPPKKEEKKDTKPKQAPVNPDQRAEEGWPTFRGGPRRTGRASAKGPRNPTLKWVFRTGGRIYADATVTKDGTVYVASHDHKLYAVNGGGREKWSYDAGGKIWTTPALAKDGTIYVGSDADRLVALSPEGKEHWVFSTEQPAKKGDTPEDGRYDVDTSPVVTMDGTVIFGCHLNLYALHPTGLLRWHFQAGVDRDKIFSSPTLGTDGTIYFGTQGAYLFALNQSAKVLYTVKTGGDNDSTPAVADDGTAVFASDDGKVRAVARTGEIKWTADMGAPIRAPVSIGHKGTVFVSTFGNEPFIAAIDGETGKEKWRFHTQRGDGDFFGIQSGATIDSEGYIYFGARDHHIYCLTPKGTLLWKHKTGDQVDSGPVIGPDGTLYVGSDDKRLYAFAEKK